jgi:hypothetical protein
MYVHMCYTPETEHKHTSYDESEPRGGKSLLNLRRLYNSIAVVKYHGINVLDFGNECFWAD